MENIFWVGLLIIIIFLLIRYRVLEMKIKSFENYDKVEQLRDLKKSINKIETELKYIKDKYGGYTSKFASRPLMIDRLRVRR